MPAAQWLPSLAAGVRDYVRVRAVREPVFREQFHTAYETARRYGAGPLRGNMNMRGEAEAFDIVATWVVQSQGLNRTLLGTDVGQIGVACTPSCSHPVMCSLLYANQFQDFDADELAFIEAAGQRLTQARREPQGEAKRLRTLLPLAKDTSVPGGPAALHKLIAKLETASIQSAVTPSAELQARARDLTKELAGGRSPGDAGSWSSRRPSGYGQPDTATVPRELVIFAPSDGEQLALRLLLEQPDWVLGLPAVSVGLWCGPHAKQGRVCVADLAVDWVAVGADLP